MCVSLRNAAHRATLHYDTALGEAGITVTMYRLLKRVDALETPSLTNMAASMGLDRSTLGRNVRVLEKQGFIRMEAGKDSRMAVARMTEAGRGTLDKAHPLWAKAQAEMSELLGPEPEKILAVLARLGNPEMQDNDIVRQGSSR